MANPTDRVGSYVFGVGNDSLGLVDEGNYFVVHNNQSGLANAATDNAFLSTNPFVLVFNKAGTGGPNLYFDFLTLVNTAIGSAGASVQAAGVIDQGNRFSSGGTELTANISNPNGNATNASNARVWAGNVTATAASSTARTIFGNRFLKGAIPVVGDTHTLKFGGNESANFLGASTVVFSSQNVPKFVIPPQSSGLVYVWLGSQTGASSYIPEMGWCER